MEASKIHWSGVNGLVCTRMITGRIICYVYKLFLSLSLRYISIITTTIKLIFEDAKFESFTNIHDYKKILHFILISIDASLSYLATNIPIWIKNTNPRLWRLHSCELSTICAEDVARDDDPHSILVVPLLLIWAFCFVGE